MRCDGGSRAVRGHDPQMTIADASMPVSVALFPARTQSNPSSIVDQATLTDKLTAFVAPPPPMTTVGAGQVAFIMSCVRAGTFCSREPTTRYFGTLPQTTTAEADAFVVPALLSWTSHCRPCGSLAA